MLKKAFFLLAFLLSSCGSMTPSAYQVRLLYKPSGIFQKFSLKALSESFDLFTYPDLEMVGQVELGGPPLEVSVPLKDSEYRFLVGPSSEDIPLNTELGCLPGKPSLLVNFIVPRLPQQVRLRISENALKPEGLEVVVEQIGTKAKAN